MSVLPFLTWDPQGLVLIQVEEALKGRDPRPFPAAIVFPDIDLTVMVNITPLRIVFDDDVFPEEGDWAYLAEVEVVEPEKLPASVTEFLKGYRFIKSVVPADGEGYISEQWEELPPDMLD